MKTLFAILSLFLCTGLWAQITPPKKTFYFQKKSKIPTAPPDTLVPDSEIKPGKALVFFYEWQSSKNPQLADADRTDRVFFELTPKEAKNFTAVNEALGKAKLIRCRMCFCVKGGCWTAIEGELTVKKVGPNRYDVTFRDNVEVEKYLIKETFTLKK